MDAPTTARFPVTPPRTQASFWSPHPLTRFPRSVAPSAKHPSPLSHSTRAPVELHRDLLLVPWPPSSVCRIRCLGELCFFASNVGHPLVCPQPLCFARSTLSGLLPVQPKLRHCRPKASLCPHHCSGAPEFPLDVSNSPTPLVSLVLPCRLCYCSPKQVCATARPPHGRPPLFGVVPTIVSVMPPKPSRALPSALGPSTRPRSHLR
jgi:hypothetical protein